jgi:hypothetical protein
MTRYDYTKIIDSLLADEFIDITAAKAARAMNDQFLSLRNRKRRITDEVKSNFAKWKKDFDRAVRNFKLPPPPSPLPQSPTPTPPSGSNGQQQPTTPH